MEVGFRSLLERPGHPAPASPVGAAQTLLDRGVRHARKDGTPRLPHPVATSLLEQADDDGPDFGIPHALHEGQVAFGEQLRPQRARSFQVRPQTIEGLDEHPGVPGLGQPPPGVPQGDVCPARLGLPERASHQCQEGPQPLEGLAGGVDPLADVGIGEPGDRPVELRQAHPPHPGADRLTDADPHLGIGNPGEIGNHGASVPAGPEDSRRGRGSDDLSGEAGDDWLLGEEGGDDLNGGPGVDLLVGGTSNDLCVDGETLLSCES